MSMKVDTTIKRLAELNVAFRQGHAFMDTDREEIYDQLEGTFRIEVSISKLVSWLPEGDGYTSCCIINQYGELCFLEIDSSDCKKSEIEKSSRSEYMKSNYFKKLKPWDSLYVALSEA